MRSQTNEEALESSIETSLVDSSFYKGSNSDFNKEYAVDEKRFWHFLESTQEDELEKLKRDPQYKQKIIQRLDRMIKKYGILKLLKQGLDVDVAHFTLMFVAPLASSSAAIKKRFDSNEFSVTRQVTYSKSNPLQEIDMVIFINGCQLSLWS